MKRKPNLPKLLLQWGVLLALAGTILRAKLSGEGVDVEAYCPFGGLQAFGSYLARGSLACSMSMLQIAMGLALAAGVVLLAKLFCGYLCPVGTVVGWLGGLGRRLGLRRELRAGGAADRLLRGVKYALLFVVFYFTLSSSELFCHKLDPYYAVATGFEGEIVLWMSLVMLVVLLAGSLCVGMFWCRYLCPLGAASNLFRRWPLLLAAALAAWALGAWGVPRTWLWVLVLLCGGGALWEMASQHDRLVPLLHVRRDVARCNGCGRCERHCPCGIAVCAEAKVRHIDCTMCGDCLAACPVGALSVGGRRSLRWLPALAAVALLLAGMWVGVRFELPTIDEQWGSAASEATPLQRYELEGLRSIKCYGSSKAFAARMQRVEGVCGVRTFVRRHAVEVTYDPTRTDTVKILEAIFTPVRQKFAAPAPGVGELECYRLGVEGLHDRTDMAWFGLALRRIGGLCGFESEFACPVRVTLYALPGTALTREQVREAVEARELVLTARDGERHIPLDYELRSFERAGTLPRGEFLERMFDQVSRLSGPFSVNSERWGDDCRYPKGIYEFACPGLEKLPLRQQIPYFRSYLSCADGIVAVDFALRDTLPVVRLHYVRELWDDGRLWRELLQAPEWRVRMSDGSEQRIAPRLRFTREGRSIDSVPAAER